jgi:hypothetical protein
MDLYLGNLDIDKYFWKSGLRIDIISITCEIV